MRLSIIDPAAFRFLSAEDSCAHYGEYTSGGGFGASETNQQIFNLKKSPTASPAQLQWKARAISYWGDVILTSAGLNLDVCATEVTFVPIPCSKPTGHPEYDDRMLQVMTYVAQRKHGIDVRPLLIQSEARDAQHQGNRSDPAGLAASLQLDRAYLQSPLRPYVIVVDDVITRGASFAAAKSVLSVLPGVQVVHGMFLAKTVHAPIEWPDFEEIN
ncbi:hypothetical protein Pfra02_33900 [Pseudomonas fragi]|nr:hypothetical protein Pfra02_33900 [Pseudomonas fragi]